MRVAYMPCFPYVTFFNVQSNLFFTLLIKSRLREVRLAAQVTQQLRHRLALNLGLPGSRVQLFPSNCLSLSLGVNTEITRFEFLTINVLRNFAGASPDSKPILLEGESLRLHTTFSLEQSCFMCISVLLFF